MTINKKIDMKIKFLEKIIKQKTYLLYENLV